VSTMLELQRGITSDYLPYSANEPKVEDRDNNRQYRCGDRHLPTNRAVVRRAPSSPRRPPLFVTRGDGF
jgi:hypothetical protein